ncbi:hypothetical protein [Pseudooceanicola aestuarii]|uniref:hypothetical protein n=1 Tax=Pseudooceanicola aestuarii TaxID=2697319 RepID=UPI0013D62485|nr:hypothetical protein [Pseudooceanicola aestuarii]
MSNTDSFIDEVNDEVRRDRLYAMLRRYGWIAILIVLLLVGGAAWREYARARDTAAAQETGDALLSALEAETPEARIAALDGVATGTPEAQALRIFLQASEAGANGNREEAAAMLDRVAGIEGLDPAYRTLAAFKALTQRAETMDPAARREAYREMATPGAMTRLLAEEQIALTHVEEGNPDEAIAVLRDILVDANVTSGLRQRATQLIVALGGTPEAEAAAE